MTDTLFDIENLQAVVKAPLAECWRCPLKDAACAKTTGSPEASIAVVSRSPGRQEALQGKAFSGLSGKVLDHLLHLYGKDRENVITTNVVLCQCDEVPQAAIDACSKRLQAEISHCETIIAAGVEATRALTGFTSVYEHRGTPFYFNKADGTRGRVVVTNNPAVVLRDDRTYLDLVRDFRLAISPRPRRELPKVRYTDDISEAIVWAKDIYQQLISAPEGTIVGTDIEARGVNGHSGLEHDAEIVCAGFATNDNRAVVFGEKPCYDRHFFVNYLKPLFEIRRLRYLWHNGRYDTKVLHNKGINARVDEDTLLLSWALDERPGDPTKGYTGHSLEYLLKEYLGYPLYEPHSVKHFKKTGELPSESAHRDLYEYNGIDTAGSIGLYEALRDAAERDNVLEWPYRNHLLPLNEALTKVELEGWLFNDKLACDLLEEQVWPQLLVLEREARRLAGLPTLNLNSPKQLAELYYDKWGLKHKLKRPKIENKGKRSTDKLVRKEILEDRFISKYDKLTVTEFTKNVDRHSTLDTQRGTYFEGLVQRQWPNGKIYYTFLIHGTESGRLSGRNPNMQNVTRPKEGMPPIRDCFIAEPGHVILNCDFNQAELRAIAAQSGDEYLTGIYSDNTRSLHKEVAVQFYGENYTYEEYVKAKNINFGVGYGQSAYGFEQLYQMDRAESQRFIDWWWDRFPGVRKWVEEVKQQVVETGELVSPFGHKRRFYLLTDENKDHALKEAVSFMGQNPAANITLWAFTKICNNIDWEIAQPKVTVHDSIALQVKTTHVDEIANYVLDTMEAAPMESISWDFPFKAEAAHGPTWAHCDTPIER